MSSLDSSEDWQALLRTIIAYPDDNLPRLVAADWLDENVGHVPCDFLRDGDIDFPCTGGQVWDQIQYESGIWGSGWRDCPKCKGAGHVPNGFAERAEFIRTMCEGRSPSTPLWNAVFGDVFFPKADGMEVGDSEAWFSISPRPGPRGFIRDGFVDEVKCEIDWWLGIQCDFCPGERRVGPSPPGEPPCGFCHGTGRPSANGPRVVARHPIRTVRLTDRTPNEIEGRGFWWWSQNGWDGSNVPAQAVGHLPPEIFWRMAGEVDYLDSDMAIAYRRYPTLADAEADASVGAIAWAKQPSEVGDAV